MIVRLQLIETFDMVFPSDNGDYAEPLEEEKHSRLEPGEKGLLINWQARQVEVRSTLNNSSNR